MHCLSSNSKLVEWAMKLNSARMKKFLIDDSQINAWFWFSLIFPNLLSDIVWKYCNSTWIAVIAASLAGSDVCSFMFLFFEWRFLQVDSFNWLFTVFTHPFRENPLTIFVRYLKAFFMLWWLAIGRMDRCEFWALLSSIIILDVLPAQYFNELWNRPNKLSMKLCF